MSNHKTLSEQFYISKKADKQLALFEIGGALLRLQERFPDRARPLPLEDAIRKSSDYTIEVHVFAHKTNHFLIAEVAIRQWDDGSCICFEYSIDYTF